MIRLTQTNGAEFYVAPTAIQATGVFSNGDTYISYVGDGGDPVTIRERAADVGRLCSAWEHRNVARELRGTLPISVGMSSALDRIDFHCCDITRKLKEAKIALAKTRRSWIERILSCQG